MMLREVNGLSQQNPGHSFRFLFSYRPSSNIRAARLA